MTVMPNDLLDLRAGIGRIQSSFVWHVLNLQLNPIGQIYPEVGATIVNDVSATSFRSVKGVLLQQSDWQDLNIYRDLIRPSMMLSDGTIWPLGVFALTTDERTVGTSESPMEVSLVDQRYRLNQAMPHSYGIPDKGLVDPALVEITGLYGFQPSQCNISPSGATVGGGPANWPPDATGLDILESLCQRAGFHPPYFDNNGILTMRAPDPLQFGAGHKYSRENGRIVVNTLRVASNLLTAPNTYKVLSSGTTSNEIYAIAQVNSSLPHSVQNRGFEVVKVIRRQGLPDQGACLTVAEAYARQSAASFATAEFRSVPDPRHDTFDVVEVDDEVYREVSWSLECIPGGAHSHRLVKDTVEVTI